VEALEIIYQPPKNFIFENIKHLPKTKPIYALMNVLERKPGRTATGVQGEDYWSEAA
jgi:hypothetical protein